MHNLSPSIRIPLPLRGYLFQFDKSPPSPYPPAIGLRMLGTCLVLEGAVRPALGLLARWAGPANRHWTGPALALIMCVLALCLTRWFICVSFERIGLSPWRDWARAEKWFVPQILAVTLVVFILSQWGRVRNLPIQASWAQVTATFFAWQLCWGFYQEFVYRGLLQTELVRRWGTIRGILAANLIFTFGPLHFYHFSLARAAPGHAWIFAAIFAIGLYFGVLYQRSRNLWMVGAVHGLGDFFLNQ